MSKIEYAINLTKGHITAYDQIQAEELYNLEDGAYIITMKLAKPKSLRTIAQNSAIHLYLRKLAQALNDAGLDMKKVLKPEVEISWNTGSAKDYLWRPIQKALTGKTSTTEIDTKEPSEIHKHLDRHISEKFGISIPFPNWRRE